MLGNQSVFLTDERMNKEDVVHIHNKVLFRHRHKITRVEKKRMQLAFVCLVQ